MGRPSHNNSIQRSAHRLNSKQPPYCSASSPSIHNVFAIDDRIESNLWVRIFCKSPCRNAIGTSDILQWGSKVIGCTHNCRWKNASRTAAAKPIIARCSQTSNSPWARPSTNFPLSSLSCIEAPGGVVDYQGEMQLMLNLQQSLHHSWGHQALELATLQNKFQANSVQKIWDWEKSYLTTCQIQSPCLILQEPPGDLNNSVTIMKTSCPGILTVIFIFCPT